MGQLSLCVRHIHRVPALHCPGLCVHVCVYVYAHMHLCMCTCVWVRVPSRWASCSDWSPSQPEELLLASELRQGSC